MRFEVYETSPNINVNLEITKNKYEFNKYFVDKLWLDVWTEWVVSWNCHDNTNIKPSRHVHSFKLGGGREMFYLTMHSTHFICDKMTSAK